MSTATIIPTDPFPYSHAAASCPSLKVLLAGKDCNLVRLVSLTLRYDGHDVEEAGDGSEMLDAMAGAIIDRDRRPFDLLIAAQDPSGITGFTVLAGLRARHWDTPFILITDDTEVQARARRLGAVVLGNPSNANAIRSAVLEAYAISDPSFVRLP
jgi:CheY-like chemotaxis protein